MDVKYSLYLMLGDFFDERSIDILRLCVTIYLNTERVTKLFSVIFLVVEQ
jgi:hypothetical protein